MSSLSVGSSNKLLRDEPVKDVESEGWDLCEDIIRDVAERCLLYTNRSACLAKKERILQVFQRAKVDIEIEIIFAKGVKKEVAIASLPLKYGASLLDLNTRHGCYMTFASKESFERLQDCLKLQSFSKTPSVSQLVEMLSLFLAFKDKEGAERAGWVLKSLCHYDETKLLEALKAACRQPQATQNWIQRELLGYHLNFFLQIKEEERLDVYDFFKDEFVNNSDDFFTKAILAIILFHGNIQENRELIFKSLASESTNGNCFADVLWGYMLENGQKDNQDRALYHYEKARKKGCSLASFRLGSYHFRQNGFSKASLDLCEESRARGSSYSLLNLGLHINHLKDDPKRAFAIFKEGADMGNASCQNMLGNFYMEGKGCQKDNRKAFSSFNKAAKLGDPEAYHNLGVCYLKGLGVEKDTKKASEYLRIAQEKRTLRDAPFRAAEISYEVFFKK